MREIRTVDIPEYTRWSPKLGTSTVIVAAHRADVEITIDLDRLFDSKYATRTASSTNGRARVMDGAIAFRYLGKVAR